MAFPHKQRNTASKNAQDDGIPKASARKAVDLGVSKNKGTPKWMVKIMENPIKMDDLGVPLFSETSTSINALYSNRLIFVSGGCSELQLAPKT